MRSTHRIASVFVLSVLLVGCAATVKKTGDAAPIKVGASATKSIVLSMTGDKDATDSKDWEPFKGLWREAMKEEAAGIGATFTALDGEPKPTGTDGTLLAVNIADFRLVSAGARYGFGVMTGNAFVNAQVAFRDLNTGEVWGERHYDTSSTAWQGVFSPMTDKQVRAICKEIATTLSGH
ncbi:MAG TPA: hypothetical protein VHS13_11310 [Edaphobacter sp.]|nr:hypothetical protein [Edaphobacter sp.]